MTTNLRRDAHFVGEVRLTQELQYKRTNNELENRKKTSF